MKKHHLSSIIDSDKKQKMTEVFMDLDYFITTLRKIISINTISSDNISEDMSNLELLNFLEEEGRKLGATAQRRTVPGTKDKENLLLRFGPDTDGGLLLSGHTDTVPCDPSQWRSDPFTLKSSGEYLYGLGVIDMKGYFAHIFSAVRDNIDISSLAKPLYVLATADEETTMAGAQAFIRETAVKPDGLVIGEPTSLVPVFQHKGFMAYEIAVQGKSGHSSDPDAGISALLIMVKIIEGIDTWAKNLRLRFPDESFSVPYPTVNIGSIQGGDSPNRICSRCSILLDMRPLASTPSEFMEKELIREVMKAAGEYHNLVTVRSLYPGMDPFATPEDSRLIRKLSELSGEKAIAVNYCTEASFLKDLHCEVAVMGAGDIADAHQPDEKLPVSEISRQHRILTELIRDYCQ